MKTDDDVFEQRVKTALDSSVAALDAGTRNQLSAMRREAIEHKPFLARWLTFGHWMPATAFAACAVLVAAVIFGPSLHQLPDPLALTDPEVALELLSNEEELGDPDFYMWLDAMLSDEEAANHAG
ncbi:MAG: hypothetical protein Fur0026_06770 [Sideroxydans sp.]